MFPLNSNTPYIKDTGERARLGSVVGGGGSDTPELPDYSISDAGKVLGVNDDGTLAWVIVSGSSFGRGVSKINGNVIVTGKEVSDAN